MRWFVFFLTLCLNVTLFPTVRILTFHYNQANFIEMQYKALKKFLKDDFELIVFNDAKTTDNEEWIEEVCNEYGIKCVRFKPEWHLADPLNTYLKMRLQDPLTTGIWGWDATTPIEVITQCASVRHSHVIQYALDHYGYDHDDIVVLLDGDNFLIKPLSIRELLGSNDIVGFHQLPDDLGKGRRRQEVSVPKNTEALWVVFIAFCPNKLPTPRELHFNVDIVNDRPHFHNNTMADTGAAVYKYLKQYPDLKIQAFPWVDSGVFRDAFSYQELKNLELSDRLIQFIKDIAPGNVQLFMFEHFIHFSGGSFEKGDHVRKVHYLSQFIDSITN